MSCKHKNVEGRAWSESYPRWYCQFACSNYKHEVTRGYADAIVCLDCGAWLSLGPSNDVGREVEIRAAEIVANDGRCDFTEYNGWRGAVTGDDDHSMGLPDWHAGFLARCIAEHKDSP